MQEKRRHDIIPGWEGATYDKNKNTGADILADFRRVPTVWSKLIGEKAEDDKGKPLDPAVTIYVDQPKEGSSQSMDGGEMGHTMIGIEYSRFSKISNRYERYKMKYGFYPAGGMTTVSNSMMMINRGAVVPGQLVDDADHGYTISRRYRATNKQVNDIIKASETYADKGYGYYSRNCTTFVKEMTVDVAHIPAAADIFRQDEVGFSGLANVGMFGAIAFKSNAAAGSENTFMDMRNKYDLSYQGIGNKRVTAQDYENYQKSVENAGDWAKMTYSPADAGERMRRLNGAGAGEMGSFSYSGKIPKNGKEVSYGLYSLSKTIEGESFGVSEIVGNIMQDAAVQSGGLPEDLINLKMEIMAMGYPLNDLNNEAISYAQKKNVARNTISDFDALPSEKIRDARSQMSENITKLNRILLYFRNDKRVHTPIMKMISLINHSLNYLDYLYNNSDRNKQVDDELGSIRGDMFTKAHEITAGGKTVTMSASHYEAYTQMYGSGANAVKYYSQFAELKNKKDRTSSEEAEFKKLCKIEQLANNFDSSHRYLLEKDSFNADDIEYIFSMGKKEKNGADSIMNQQGESASGTYQSLLLQKVFGGMKERMMQEAEFNDLTEVDGSTFQKVQDWLDKDMFNCISKKAMGLSLILVGMKWAMDDQKKDKLMEEFMTMMITNWFKKVFRASSSNKTMSILGQLLPGAFMNIMSDKSSKTRNAMEICMSAALSKGPL